MEQVLRYIEGTHNIAFTQLTPISGDVETFWALVGSGKDTTFTIVSKAKCGKNYETFLFENKQFDKEYLNCCLCGGRFTHVQYYSLCNVCAPFHAHSQKLFMRIINGNFAYNPFIYNHVFYTDEKMLIISHSSDKTKWNDYRLRVYKKNTMTMRATGYRKYLNVRLMNEFLAFYYVDILNKDVISVIFKMIIDCESASFIKIII
jgi:hypothetical protein